MSGPDRTAPAAAFRQDLTVSPQWVDYNGHMGDFAYGIAFSETVTAFMAVIGVDAAYRQSTKATLYTLDSRIGFRKECHGGDVITLSLHVLDTDSKRLHLYLAMTNQEGEILAWNTQVLVHVSQAGAKPKSASFPPKILRLLQDFALTGAPLLSMLPEISRPLGLQR